MGCAASCLGLLESYRGRREPGGLCGPRKHVTKAKEGPWRREAKIHSGGKKGVGGGCAGMLERECESTREQECTGSFALRVLVSFLKAGIFGKISRELSSEYSSTLQ